MAEIQMRICRFYLSQNYRVMQSELCNPTDSRHFQLSHRRMIPCVHFTLSAYVWLGASIIWKRVHIGTQLESRIYTRWNILKKYIEARHHSFKTMFDKSINFLATNASRKRKGKLYLTHCAFEPITNHVRKWCIKI